MPLDSMGKHHFSGQQARHADGMKGMKGGSAPKAPAMKSPGAHEGDEPKAEGGAHSTIHHHEDGTHSVEHSDGEKSGPHAHLHEAMAHVAAKHGSGGKHHFARHDGMGGGVTTHRVGEDGDVQGEEHGSPDEAMESGKNFMNDEGGEDESAGDDEGGMMMGHGHGGGLSGFGG